MNAVFVVMWRRPEQEFGELVGVAASFDSACQVAEVHAIKTATKWNKGLEADEQVSVKKTKQGVPYLDEDGHVYATAVIKEEVILVSKPVKTCPKCGSMMVSVVKETWEDKLETVLAKGN